MCCRPQLGGAFLAAVVMSLMALVPFLSFMWHVTCVLAVFVAVDSVALKDKCFAYFIRITIFLFVRAPGLKVTQKALLNNIIITKKQNYKPEIIIRANGKFLEDWLTNNFETKFAKLKLLWVILLVSSVSSVSHFDSISRSTCTGISKRFSAETRTSCTCRTTSRQVSVHIGGAVFAIGVIIATRRLFQKKTVNRHAACK